MTWKEMEKASLNELADYLKECQACPAAAEGGNEFPCVVDKEGNLDCVECWKMVLKGEERGETYDEWCRDNWSI